LKVNYWMLLFFIENGKYIYFKRYLKAHTCTISRKTKLANFT